MVALEPVVQAYAWGSRTALPELCGITSPAPHPVAEHWFGAHDSGSSRCSDGRGLDARIAADPERELGPRVLAEHGGGLPFLVKLLSAEQALSLQAHPSPEKAREGFAAEDARGIAVDAPDRNYRDVNHKPEILVALTEFHALVGFRPVERTVALLDALGVASLKPYRDMLAGQPDAEGLRAVFTTFVTMPHVVLAGVVPDLVTCAVSYLTDHGVEGPWSPVAATITELAERYPTDPGVLGALLLNRVVLQPGEAVYLGPGQLHAYLRGVGVEVMANSDNVLRGGLTPKHVDVPELMR
ncbi:MAG: mannose-6-phosphate isomerase, class I, partial [Dietzia sp.]|nr:mannose-6-phosphate isomerase, class I [Dietzia sp.]